MRDVTWPSANSPEQRETLAHSSGGEAEAAVPIARQSLMSGPLAGLRMHSGTLVERSAVKNERSANSTCSSRFSAAKSDSSTTGNWKQRRQGSRPLAYWSAAQLSRAGARQACCTSAMPGYIRRVSKSASRGPSSVASGKSASSQRSLTQALQHAMKDRRMTAYESDNAEQQEGVGRSRDESMVLRRMDSLARAVHAYTDEMRSGKRLNPVVTAIALSKDERTGQPYIAIAHNTLDGAQMERDRAR